MSQQVNTPINQAVQTISNLAQQVQTQNITVQQQQTTQQQVAEFQAMFTNIITNMLQITNDLAYDIATLDKEDCLKCKIVTKVRTLIKLLKELLELQKKFRTQ